MTRPEAKKMTLAPLRALVQSFDHLSVPQRAPDYKSLPIRQAAP
jgi:hypothetical protein